MIDLSLGSLIAYTFFLFAGIFIGVMLGRRSKTANAYADRIQSRLDEAEAELRALRDRKSK